MAYRVSSLARAVALRSRSWLTTAAPRSTGRFACLPDSLIVISSPSSRCVRAFGTPDGQFAVEIRRPPPSPRTFADGGIRHPGQGPSSVVPGPRNRPRAPAARAATVSCSSERRRAPAQCARLGTLASKRARSRASEAHRQRRKGEVESPCPVGGFQRITRERSRQPHCSSTSGGGRRRVGTGQLLLKPGDRLVLYTDGVTDAVDESGRLFSEASLREALRGAGTLSSKDVVARVLEQVRRFSGGALQADDITLLVLGYVGFQEGTETTGS